MTPTFTTVTSTGAMNAGSLTVTGASNLNGAADLNGNKITSVANGTVATDAVNFGQLKTTNNNVNNAQASANSAQTSANNAQTTATNAQTTATTALTEANKGFNIKAGSSTVDNVKLGETFGFTNTDSNLVVTNNATDNTVNYNLAQDIDLGPAGSVTTGNTVTNSAGVSITDGTNVTTMTSPGTNVTDGTNTSDYGSEGFTATDAAGNNGISINQGGISFIDAGGAPTGPSITAGGQTVSNLADGVNANDAATKGQVDAVSDGLTDLTAGAVQYDRDPNDNSIINYDQVTLAGTPAVIDQDDEGNDFVANGGTTLSNVANGVNADDAVNKGQLDTLIAQNVTNVEVTDQNGNPVTVNVTDQVVNRNIDDSNMDSQFLTYDVNGQEVTDRLTIGETVQKMNTEGIKFAHTNAVSTEGDIGVTNDSSAGGDNSTAIGVNAIVEGFADNSVALGRNTLATNTATNSVVIGNGSQVAGQSSVAIGDGAQALGNQSISIGTGNIVNGDNSGAFGDPSTINGNNSYSIGNNNTINSDDTFVLGNGITANQNGSVVLGLGSAATTGAGIVGYRAAGNAAITATTSTTGAVAVGDAANGVYRQVTGVAAGTADSDAVNVSQLKSVSDALESSNEALSNAAVQYDTNPDDTVNKGSITLGGGAAGTTITNVNGGAINAGSTDAINGGQLYNLGNDVAGIIGGDAAIDDEGNLTATNIGGTGANNLNDAIAAVNNGNAQANEDIQANTSRLDTGLSFSADSGSDFNKSVGNSTALKFEGSDNITTTTTDSGIKFDLSGNINVDSVTADTVTTGNTTVNTNGVTIANGPSMTTEGINAGGKTITGVADGLNPTDAVNFGQLTALDGKLSNSVNELGYKINEVEDDANAGISAAMATSSLPQAYIPGKSMIGGGVATYNGESAVAIGLSKVSDNGRWVMRINGTADTQGNAGGAIGAGFHF
ncbi:YadA-like family protein [Psychrobacter sp. SIMBA_152]